MAGRKDDAYYEVVTAGQEVYYHQTPSNGAEWIIEEFYADAPSSSDGWVALVWDYGGAGEEILSLTYTSTRRDIHKSIIGDGTKKLALVLHNEGGTDLAMGGGYRAKEL